MLLYATEVNVKFMEMLQKGTEGGALSHFGKGVNIFRKALATIAKLTIWTRYIGVSIINITREKNTCVNLAPVCTHLFTVLATSIKVGDFISSKYIVHVLRQLSL